MEGIIFRIFETIFKTIGVLLLTGALTSVFTDIHKRAFQSQKVGLASMLKTNEQLVGKIYEK